MRPEMDGRDRYTFGLAIPTAILWQPRFGYLALAPHDSLGAIYAPLIRIDRRFFHPTIYIFDDEKDTKASSLPIFKVHPFWRDAYLTRFRATALPIDEKRVIECNLLLTGTRRPHELTELRISRELVMALGVTAPTNFTQLDWTDHQSWRSNRYVRWVGKVPLVTNQNTTLLIPIQRFDGRATGEIWFTCEDESKMEKVDIVKLGISTP